MPEIEPESALIQSGDTVKMWVGMDYPGSVISVNHCYAHGPNGRKFLKKEARSWRKTLATSFGWLVKANRLYGLPYEKILIQIDGHFIDAYRSLDADNMQKLTWDAIKEAMGVDDKQFQPAEGVKTFGNPIPFIVVTVHAELAPHWRDVARDREKTPPADGRRGRRS
jgi:Holliday junction resolvase RusA-like endonuclease